MRSAIKLLCAAAVLAVSSVPVRAASVFQPNDLTAICGDSITEQKVYSVYIEDYLLMCQSVPGVKAMQCGWSGASANSTLTHIKTDVVTLRPNVVTLYYGMNDGGYLPANPATEASYRDSLTKIIAMFKAVGTRTVIVGSPGIVDSTYFKNPHHKEVSAAEYNAVLGRLGDVAKSVAESNGVIFADLHHPMMQIMQEAKAAYGKDYPVEGDADGIHAGPPGHLLMAYCFLKAMGFDGNIGTITADMAAGSTTATDGHRIVSSARGKITIESTRYPFCFFGGTKDGDKADAATQAENYTYGDAAILKFVPFNQDLNRYLLVVKNLKSAKAKVTWGEESKEFTAAELKQGINLAAEFQKGPFVKHFFEVHKAVQAKQAYESLFIRQYLSDMRRQLLNELPDKQTAIAGVTDNMKGIEAGFFQNVAAAVKPVTHTIQIVEMD